ncbi:MAG: 50S ribosomal protein L5 [Thermodesulfovibrionales bacterium]|nr:50S ribosomal protein L5 [Thermodesulfovibrionales bacterium]
MKEQKQPVKESKQKKEPKKEPKETAPKEAVKEKKAKGPKQPEREPRLKEKYVKEGVPALMKEFLYSSPMQVPKLQKVVLNVGLGEAIQNIKLLDSVQKELSLIAGQRAVVTKAKKDIAGFKLRKGMPIGCMVTLRGRRMYEFLDRLISLSLPRIRDFKGVSSKTFDGRGNYALGVKEQFIFPEIDYDKVEITHGMDVIICTTAGTNAEGKALLGALGMPFK